MVTLMMDVHSFSLGKPHEKLHESIPLSDRLPRYRKVMVDPLYPSLLLYL